MNNQPTISLRDAHRFPDSAYLDYIKGLVSEGATKDLDFIKLMNGDQPYIDLVKECNEELYLLVHQRLIDSGQILIKLSQFKKLYDLSIETAHHEVGMWYLLRISIKERIPQDENPETKFVDLKFDLSVIQKKQNNPTEL